MEENYNIDLSELKALKNNHIENPFICYLNINSLRYKIVDPRHVLETTGLEIVAISETKVSDEFRNEQFSIEGYSFPPYRRDMNQHGGGLMVFIKKRCYYEALDRI